MAEVEKRVKGLITLANMQKQPVFGITEKTCSNKDCEHKGEPQPIENFLKKDCSYDGYNYWCKGCFKKYRHQLKLRKKENVINVF